MPGRRSSTDSSLSRSLSPYNKRRRGRSPDVKGRRSRSPVPRSKSRKSRSPRRSRSPKRRPSPRKYTSSTQQRRRSSPSRSYGNRPAGPSTRGRSPPPSQLLPRKRTPSPRGRKWSPSPRRRSPSPKRKRSPEHRPPPARHHSPHTAPRDRHSPARDYHEPPPPRQQHQQQQQSREHVVVPRNRSLEERSRAMARNRSRSLSPPRMESRSQGHRSNAPEIRQTSNIPQQHPAHNSPQMHSSYRQQVRRRSPSPQGRRKSDLHRSRSRSRERKMSPLGSKDMDYRDKRMGDPRATKPEAKKEERGYYREKTGDDGGYYGDQSTTTRSSNNKSPERLSSYIKLGYTGNMCNSRFSLLDSNPPEFKPRDTISIAIERNILGDEPAVISPVFKPELVVVTRRPQEGEKAVCDRDEFVMREQEYEERRVIKVVSQPGADHKGKDRYDLEERENFEVLPLSDRWGKKPKIEQQVSIRKESLQIYPSSGRNVERRSLDQADPLRHGDRDERLVQPRSSSRRRERSVSPGADKDERIISQRSDSHRREDEVWRGERGDHRSAKYERDPNDLRHNLARKRREGGPESNMSDARERIEKRRVEERRRSDGESVVRRFEHKSETEGELPDFSKRPDKGKYQEWQENPEIIPKSVLYYEVSPSRCNTSSKHTGKTSLSPVDKRPASDIRQDKSKKTSTKGQEKERRWVITSETRHISAKETTPGSGSGLKVLNKSHTGILRNKIDPDYHHNHSGKEECRLKVDESFESRLSHSDLVTSSSSVDRFQSRSPYSNMRSENVEVEGYNRSSYDGNSNQSFSRETTRSQSPKSTYTKWKATRKENGDRTKSQRPNSPQSFDHDMPEYRNYRDKNCQGRYAENQKYQNRATTRDRDKEDSYHSELRYLERECNYDHSRSQNFPEESHRRVLGPRSADVHFNNTNVLRDNSYNTHSNDRREESNQDRREKVGQNRVAREHDRKEQFKSLEYHGDKRRRSNEEFVERGHAKDYNYSDGRENFSQNHGRREHGKGYYRDSGGKSREHANQQYDELDDRSRYEGSSHNHTGRDGTKGQQYERRYYDSSQYLEPSSRDTERSPYVQRVDSQDTTRQYESRLRTDEIQGYDLVSRSWSPVRPPSAESFERTTYRDLDRGLSRSHSGNPDSQSADFIDRQSREEKERKYLSDKHDNRDNYDYWERQRGRGRGRGGYRGRPYRGRGRGRDFYPPRSSRSSVSEPQWKHDKFQDEEPSSTTK